MKQERIELLPGVWLRAVHTDKFKSAYLSVTLMAPLTAQTAALNALVPFVLRRGCQGYEDMQAISAALDELYGGGIEPAVRKKGETQCVGFVASFLDDAYTPDGSKILEAAAKLLGDLLTRPVTQNGVFKGEYVEGEKGNLIDAIRAQVNDKRRYAQLRLTQLMCREEAFGIDRLGDEYSAAAIDSNALWQQYQQLLRTAPIEIYYCGSAEAQRVADALRTGLSALPLGQERVEPDCEIRITAGEQPQVLEEAMDVGQGKLSLGFRTGGIAVWEEEYPALVLCNAIFGGTTLSKLFMNVRERLSLCYYASSTIERMKGIMLVASGIEFDKYQQAKDEILAQLEQIRQGNVDETELEGARRIMVGGYLTNLDAQDRLEDFWLGQAAAGVDTEIEELVARLEGVTAAQVQQVAQRLKLDAIYFLKGQEG